MAFRLARECRLDRGALVNDTIVVEEDGGPGGRQRKPYSGCAQLSGTVGGKDPRFTADDPLARNKNDGDEIDAITMGPLRGWSADAPRRRDPERVHLDEELRTPPGRLSVELPECFHDGAER